MTQRVLITGGAGFIGSHTADLLLARGCEIEVLDDLSTGKLENVPEGATFHRGDVRLPECARLIRDGTFDAIVHLAAQMDVRRSVADPLFDLDINVRGTLNVLEAVRSLEKRPRVVFASTGGVLYGDHTRPPNHEVTPKEPDSPYAIAKLSAEYYLTYYARIHGLETVALRFANVYGPRQDPHGEAGVVAILCGRLIDGEPLKVFGDGLQTRDYVYVTDVAEAIRRALQLPLVAPTRIDARAFNIGTGVGTSVLDLASSLRRASGIEVPTQFAPRRPGEQQDSFVAVAKAKNELGWMPQVELEAGLAETFAWFAARAKAESTIS
ncbi:MAG TPA: NAD-dependent epimerase/dehydratase family protein [Gemmatimonadaceae bacterium]|jgi:UDP-glucose 4-epimerase